MSITINAKGTSVTTFTVGKAGTIISQGGEITPPAANDLTFNLGSTKSLIVDNGSTSILISSSLITTGATQDLTIQPDGDLILNQDTWPSTTGTTGQVLVTSGAGILSWQTFAPKYQLIIATAAQSVFNTTINTIANGSGKTYLQIFINGIKQIEGATRSYTVTGANQITFNSGLLVNDEVEFISFA